MSKAKIYIEYNGKTYRVGQSHRCASKRDCDLYERGVCGRDGVFALPCDAIGDAFLAVCGACPNNCFKEVVR